MQFEKSVARAVTKGVAVVLLSTSAAAVAGQNDWAELDAEIRNCVAAVGEHADFADATRVRHAVVDIKERTVGYRLSIETSLYNEQDDAAIRAYAASCVINGDYAPLQFTIAEAQSGQ